MPAKVAILLGGPLNLTEVRKRYGQWSYYRDPEGNVIDTITGDKIMYSQHFPEIYAIYNRNGYVASGDFPGDTHWYWGPVYIWQGIYDQKRDLLFKLKIRSINEQSS